LVSPSSVQSAESPVAHAEMSRPKNHQVFGGANQHLALYAAAHDPASPEGHAVAALTSPMFPMATVCARPRIRCQLRHSCRLPTTIPTRQVSVAQSLGAGNRLSNAPSPSSCSTGYSTCRRPSDFRPGAILYRIPFRRSSCLFLCPCSLLPSQHLNLWDQQGPAGWHPPVHWTRPALSCSQLLSPGLALAPWGHPA